MRNSALPDLYVWVPAPGSRWEVQAHPRLESWDRLGAPSQVQLATWLDAVEVALGLPAEPLLDSGLVLDLAVGLEPHLSLTEGGRDLDNYLFPILRRLGAGRFVSAWASKRHGRSSVAVGPAVERAALGTGWSFAQAEPLGPPDRRAWKEQIVEQLALQAGPASPGPLELQVAYYLSPKRNWTTLWKPTLDSLGLVLGHPPGRAFSPYDDRVVRVGFHRFVEDARGWDVSIRFAWRALDSSG